MSENIGNILFVIAGIIWGIELIPQLIKTIRTKSVGDISLFFLTLCFTAFLIFITGCYLIGNWFLFFSHLIPFMNVCILFYLVLKYKEKPQHFPPNNKAQAAYIEKECSGECDTCPYNKET